LLTLSAQYAESKVHCDLRAIRYIFEVDDTVQFLACGKHHFILENGKVDRFYLDGKLIFKTKKRVIIYDYLSCYKYGNLTVVYAFPHYENDLSQFRYYSDDGFIIVVYPNYKYKIISHVKLVDVDDDLCKYLKDVYPIK
jgi:hypothetical protein